MTKLGAINFDDCILDALRDDQLIVFAGAGVSMGPPSNLSDFWRLAGDIAQGTGSTPSEPLDRFLGQLQHSKVAVHERAAQLLSPPESFPNVLHYDLLRMFQTAERVKLVTTNFDLHFETAANELFGTDLETYRAPALPLGYDFSGIVHIHGALPKEQSLVLTDVDFGRAYLTEGWARRFLVDAFRRYTILFVGYSHNDVVMNYLARALPADSLSGRFALTDEDGSWELLGIKPIRFVKGSGADSYNELYNGIKQLAERATRGALDWQSRLAEMGSRTPPTDEEAISEIEQALREVHTTRFLLNVASDPEWLRWLNARSQLDALFGTDNLDERNMLLVTWLTKNFVIDHPEEVFEIVAAHGLQLNPELWSSIGRQIGNYREKPLEESALRRWASILLASEPSNANHFTFLWLAERCGDEGCIDLTLKIFLAMSRHQLRLKSRFVLPGSGANEYHPREAVCPLRADNWSLNEVWTNHLKPHLTEVIHHLLSGIELRFEEIYGELSAWGQASCEWDPISYARSAIEPHDQDQYPEAIDVLIDAARDALEWLATQKPELLNAWVERLIVSRAPLLRRLAINAITAQPERSAEEKLKWLLERVGLHEAAEHHEVHRTVALSYPSADYTSRKAVVEAVLAHKLPAFDNWSSEERTVRSHFDWLSWLLLAKPDCSLASSALAPIKAQYPNWQPSDHPDLTHWTGPADWVSSESPWSVEQLLALEPQEQLDEILNFKSNRFEGPSREALLSNCHNACKQNTNWAFAMGRALTERALWSSDIWSALIRGLIESDLSAEGWRDLLTLASNPELQAAHASDIAKLLEALVTGSGKSFALDLLEQANAIALPLWQALEPNTDEDGYIEEWLSSAINRPAGVIVEFWLNSLSLLVQGKTKSERAMPESYRHWFTLVVQDATTKGGMGRSLLASQIAFLFNLDELWTRKHILPLFSDSNKQKFEQSWDGFLTWGRFYPALVDALLPAFVSAIPKISSSPKKRRQRFIKFFTALAVLHITDPTQCLLPAFFKCSSREDRLIFASEIRYFLSQMQQPAKQELWNGWLCDYWQDRIQGVYAPLNEDEIRKMLEWLPHLGDTFPSAVAMAVRFPKIQIKHSHILFELCNSNLVTLFPNETAELLIYLAGSSTSFHAEKLAEIYALLHHVSPQVRDKLDEAFALAGVNKMGK